MSNFAYPKPLPNLSRPSPELLEPQTEPQTELPNLKPNFLNLKTNLCWTLLLYLKMSDSSIALSHFAYPNPYQTSCKPLRTPNRTSWTSKWTFAEPLWNLLWTSPKSPSNFSRISFEPLLNLPQLNFLIVLSRQAIWLPTWILIGFYSLFSANFCSNTFEIFHIKL